MNRSSPVALLPLGLFLALFIGSGLYYQSTGTEYAFYKISGPVAILPAIILAILLDNGSLTQRVERFIAGVADNTLITMVLIFLLAGAFGSVAKAVGGVDSTVNLGLSIVPSNLILPCLFLITAFIATSMGTSMGTIAAVAPIAVGVAESTDLPLAITTATVLGGAMFGDNLSIISDTTIAATRTQGCDMRDKFRFNLKIALPAALVTLLVLFFVGENAQIKAPGDYNLLQVVPYLAVLILAVSGLNVFAVLIVGILLAGATGFITQDDYTVADLSSQIYSGYGSMQEILILSLMIGGLGALMKNQGGLNWIANSIEKFGKSGNDKQVRKGEFSLSLSVFRTNFVTPNNTISNLPLRRLAKDIATRYNVDPRRAASLLDIFSCVVQGLIPYGAQMLLAASLAKLSPLELTGSTYYCWLLGVAAVISIIIGRPRS